MAETRLYEFIGILELLFATGSTVYIPSGAVFFKSHQSTGGIGHLIQIVIKQMTNEAKITWGYPRPTNSGK